MRAHHLTDEIRFWRTGDAPKSWVREWPRTLRGGEDALEDVAAGVWRVPVLFVNAYFVGDASSWVLVDAGVPGSTGRIVKAAEACFGAGTRPAAIVLTHGHFDHAGSALDLARRWQVPIYAHRDELPFLNGESDYPPQDPTLGGAISFLSRFFPTHGYDFGERLRPLPDDGSVPGLTGWAWLHTPGHTPGHVSLFRPAGRLLVAGDAFTTMDLDSWASQMTRRPEVDRPPAPFTPDWRAAHRSVEALAELAPELLAAGHGMPIVGEGAATALRELAREFPAPSSGRYAARAPATDEHGVLEMPPPVDDPLPKRVGVGLALAAGVVVGGWWWGRRGRR